MNIEIKSYATGAVLFTGEFGSIKLALCAAVNGGADLGGADLRRADLGGADLRGAYLGGADLCGAYLRRADLGGAYLRGAYLRRADLGGAYLRGAYLGGADLGGAYLRGADLRAADLGGAYLRGADLCGGVKDVYHLGYPGGYSAHAWLRDGVLSIRIGCREFRYAEAVKHWENRADRIEQFIATEYARQIALARGWKTEP